MRTEGHEIFALLTRRRLLVAGVTALAGIGLAACGGSAFTAAVSSGAGSVVTTSLAQAVTTAAQNSATAATSGAAISTSAATSVAGGKGVTLQLVGWDSKLQLDLVQNFYQDQFTKLHPDISVAVISTAGGDFNDKITTLVAGGTPPNMMYVQDYVASSWVHKNVLLDLTPYASTDKDATVKQNWPNAIGFFQLEGKLYGLPKDFSSMVIYYNKDLFAAAGIQPPSKAGWTWDDFLQAAHKLTKPGSAEQQWGFTLRTGSDSGIGPWIWQNGGDFFADPHQPTQFTLDQAQAVDAIQWYADLIYKEHVAPTPDELKGQGDLFAKGRIAMTQNWTSAMVGYRTSIKGFTWDAIAMPKQKVAAIPLTAVALGIPATAKNQDATWEALKFYNGPAGSEFVLSNGWGIPADQAVGASAAFLKDTPPDNKQVFLDQVQYARLWPQSYAWPDQRAVILKALNPVLGGQQQAHDAISAIKQQVLSTQ
ncbi:MAG: ABC transporter substrate-binding protein [Chloroflexota bacterium]